VPLVERLHHVHIGMVCADAGEELGEQPRLGLHPLLVRSAHLTVAAEHRRHSANRHQGSALSLGNGRRLEQRPLGGCRTVEADHDRAVASFASTVGHQHGTHRVSGQRRGRLAEQQ